MIRVSIVTPSFNQGRFIEDAILSVKNQDYPNIEHIVIDGGSTDETVEILKNYEKRYDLRWISEADRGQSDAVNKGFRLAKGQIIGWLNSDDAYFHTDTVSYAVGEFKNNPNIDVIYGDHVSMDEDSLILKVRHVVPKFDYERLLRTDFICQPSVFLRRNIIQKHKLDMDLHLPMDYEYWLRIARENIRFKHVKKILSANRIHKSMKTRNRRSAMEMETKKVQERYGQKFGYRYHLSRRFDDVLFILLKAYGVKTMIDLYANQIERRFSFHGKVDSLLKATFRQLFFV